MSQATPPVLRSFLIALALGSLIAVTVVLPAEYNVDPTGLGETLGLMQLSAESNAPASIETPPAPTAPGVNRITVKLGLEAGEGREYKLQVLKGEVVSYRWIASEPIHYDLHGEPLGDTSGYYETYALGVADGVEGKFTALFDGTHGWYWRNDSDAAVEIDLMAAGSFEVPQP